MSRRLGSILFAMFSGALLGYIWGWIWGWSLFDPNSDVWALAAGVGALLGLLLGALRHMRANAVSLLCATIGLLLSWYARTLIFGDIPGGWGILLMLVGSAAGLALGIFWQRRCSARLLRALLWALYAGFFGGFLIDVLLLDVVLGLVETHSVLSQAPWVILCGVVGGWVGIQAAR